MRDGPRSNIHDNFMDQLLGGNTSNDVPVSNFSGGTVNNRNTHTNQYNQYQVGGGSSSSNGNDRSNFSDSFNPYADNSAGVGSGFENDFRAAVNNNSRNFRNTTTNEVRQIRQAYAPLEGRGSDILHTNSTITYNNRDDGTDDA